MYDGSSVGAGSKPARPIGTTRPGGGNYSEETKGYDILSGSGARGTAGRFEGAAGQ